METEMHCKLVKFLSDEGVPDDEISGMLLEAGINAMLAEDETPETIAEAVQMILEEDSDDGDSED